MNLHQFYWNPDPNDVILTLLILSLFHANERWNPNDIITVTHNPNTSHTPSYLVFLL